MLAGRLTPSDEAVQAIDVVDQLVAAYGPTELSAAAQPAGFAARTLVIGAGRGAPVAVNHEHFAKAGPPGVAHVVIPSMGHGDMLDDRPVRTARLLCGGSDHPARDRTTVGLIMSRFFGGTLPTADETPVKIVVR